MNSALRSLRALYEWRFTHPYSHAAELYLEFITHREEILSSTSEQWTSCVLGSQNRPAMGNLMLQLADYHHYSFAFQPNATEHSLVELRLWEIALRIAPTETRMYVGTGGVRPLSRLATLYMESRFSTETAFDILLEVSAPWRRSLSPPLDASVELRRESWAYLRSLLDVTQLSREDWDAKPLQWRHLLLGRLLCLRARGYSDTWLLQSIKRLQEEEFI